MRAERYRSEESDFFSGETISEKEIMQIIADRPSIKLIGSPLLVVIYCHQKLSYVLKLYKLLQ